MFPNYDEHGHYRLFWVTTKIGAKIQTTVKSKDLTFVWRLATDLVSERPAVVVERPVVEKERPAVSLPCHYPWRGTHLLSDTSHYMSLLNHILLFLPYSYSLAVVSLIRERDSASLLFTTTSLSVSKSITSLDIGMSSSFFSVWILALSLHYKNSPQQMHHKFFFFLNKMTYLWSVFKNLHFH